MGIVGDSWKGCGMELQRMGGGSREVLKVNMGGGNEGLEQGFSTRVP